jgi:hypothetical protein
MCCRIQVSGDLAESTYNEKQKDNCGKYFSLNQHEQSVSGKTKLGLQYFTFRKLPPAGTIQSCSF